MASVFWSSTHCNHWTLTREDLALSRTADLNTLTARQISTKHIFFANLISKLGKKLSLRHTPIHTAIVYFKRFYLCNSFEDTDPWEVIPAVVYLAAKVEETPVHIKTVVSESRAVFSEYGIKSFTSDYTKLAEMEFYLLEDLRFDLVIYHPHRSLLAICNRAPADGGDFSDSDSDDGESPAFPKPSRGSMASRKRKRSKKDEGEEDGLDGMGKFGEAAGKKADGMSKEGEVGRANLVDKANGKGSGEDALEVEDSVVQMAWYIINDTYRTDLILIYPPYIIALSALYLSFALSDTKPDAGSYRVKGKRWIPLEHTTTTLQDLPVVVNGGKGLLTKFDAPEWFAALRVGLPEVLEAVQEVVSVYSLWEELDTAGAAVAGIASLVGRSGVGR